MEKRTYNLCVKDTVFDPNDPQATIQKKATYKKYCQIPDGKILYKVWIYVDGYDLPFVESVRYHLHSSFPDRTRLVERDIHNRNCAFIIWAWGMFNVKAEVFLIGGQMLTINHFLSFGEEIASNDDIQWNVIKTHSLQNVAETKN